VTVESRLGHGATFHIWLPVASNAPQETASVAPKPAAASAGKRVLFMDDEEIIRSVAVGILRHLGHDPVVVGDGADAVREFATAMKAGKPFDVVVLDLTVPGGMGGRAAIDELRKIDPKVRAIVSSGYSSDPVLANFRQYGFAAVVPKPYQLEELARAIIDVASERTD
jgi:CheY-like chemotaxis protein